MTAKKFSKYEASSVIKKCITIFQFNLIIKFNQPVKALVSFGSACFGM